METKEINCVKTITIPDGKRLKDIEITVTPIFEDILEEGDIFYVDHSNYQKFIGLYNKRECAGMLNFGDGWKYQENLKDFIWNSTLRKATEEEIKIFKEILNQNDLDYDKDTKSIIPYKWKPMFGNIYYFIEFNRKTGKFIINSHVWCEDSEDNALYNSKFGIFKNKSECDIKCDKLNKTICQE